MGMTLETDSAVSLRIGDAIYDGRVWRFQPLLPWSGDESAEADAYRALNTGKWFECRFFAGIRYATARRWRAPVLHDPGPVRRDASRFVAVCPQGGAFEDNDLGREPTGLTDGVYDFADYPVEEDEDCLRVAIWRPVTAPPAGGWPTLVYFHGGGHDINSIASYQGWGHWLAAMGIQVIAVGYRLGLLGYMYHPDWEDEVDWTGPHFAHQDRRAALDWIALHAADLDVDTARLCLYGGSAGGESVLMMLSDAEARGKFTRAVACSGGGFNHDIYARDSWRGQGYVRRAARIERTLQAMGGFPAPGGQSYAQIAAARGWGAALRAMPAETVVQLQEQGFDGANQFPWLPEALFPHASAAARAEAGLFADVPVMLWYTGNEAITLGVREEGDPVPGNPSANAEIVGQNYANMCRGAPWDGWAENERQRMLFVYRTYGAPAYAIAHALAGQGRAAWLCLWNYASAGLNSGGAGHVSNISYAFGHPQWQISLTEGLEAKIHETDLRVWWRSAVHLVRFVANGDPNAAYAAMVDLGLWATPLTPWDFEAFSTSTRVLNTVGSQARWPTPGDDSFTAWAAGWSSIFQPFRTGAK